MQSKCSVLAKRKKKKSLFTDENKSQIMRIRALFDSVLQKLK